MGTYLMMLYVSLDQEEAVKDFFMGKGWCFKKPDLSVTTDKTGPLLIQDTAYTELRETVEPNQTVTETVSDRKLKPAPKLRVTPKRSKRKVKAKASTGPKKTENAEFQDILHEAEIIAASINETETPEGEATATEVKVEQEYVVEYNDNSDEDNFDDYDDFNEQETDGVMPSTSEVQGASDAPAPSTSITTPTATKKRKLSGKGKDSKDAEEDEDLVAEETPIKDPRSKRKRLQYDRSDVKKAFAATQKGMSVYRAARKFKVPESTLRDRTRGIVTLDCKPGTDNLFSENEETKLVGHIKYMTDIGKGYNKINIQQIAKEYALSLGKEVKAAQHLSNSWYYRFRQRWPEITIATPSKPTSSKAESEPQENMTNYYKQIGSLLSKH